MSRSDDAKFYVVPITDENRQTLADIALSVYIGRQCVQCGHTYDSIADLQDRDPKRGYGDGIPLVCTSCWGDHLVAHIGER